MRIIGLDIHRVFAEAVALDNGELRRLGRIGMTRNHLEAFARTLCLTDHVVVEATSNATAVTEILAPYVARVAVANPLQVHLIAKAKIKTDAIDARILAKLYAACPRSGSRTRRRWPAGGRSRDGPNWFDRGSASSRSCNRSSTPI
jgi:transposase